MKLLTAPIFAFSAFTLAAPAAAERPTLAEARASTIGTWTGELQYRDYQSNQWIGIPVTVTVEPAGDGVTLIRRASFDDGASGTVTITLVNMLGPDGTTENIGSFRADRPAELGEMRLELREAEDAENWTIVARQEGFDDNRPANIRETTVREGDRLVTLKEVDFSDDKGVEWVQRNRTVLVGE